MSTNSDMIPVMMERTEWETIRDWLGPLPVANVATSVLYDNIITALSRHPDDAPRHSNRELREAQREALIDALSAVREVERSMPLEDAFSRVLYRFPSLPPAPRPWGPEITLSNGYRYRTNGKAWQWDGISHRWELLGSWPTCLIAADFETVRQAWLAAGGTFDTEEG